MDGKMNCPRDNCQNEAIVHPTYGVLPCAFHQSLDAETTVHKPPEFYSASKQDRIQDQRDRHAADIEQPFIGNKPNPKFAKIYPKSVKNYFTPQQLKNID